MTVQTLHRSLKKETCEKEPVPDDQIVGQGKEM